MTRTNLDPLLYIYKHYVHNSISSRHNMKPTRLLQLAILVMATTAAPIYTEPTHNLTVESRSTHIPSVRPYPGDDLRSSKRPKTNDRSLLSLLDRVDVITEIQMARPRAPGTTNPPDAAVRDLPASISITLGSFDPRAIIRAHRNTDTHTDTDLFEVDAETYRRTEAVFDAPRNGPKP